VARGETLPDLPNRQFLTPAVKVAIENLKNFHAAELRESSIHGRDTGRP
jgi:hypothetical protein